MAPRGIITMAIATTKAASAAIRICVFVSLGIVVLIVESGIRDEKCHQARLAAADRVTPI